MKIDLIASPVWSTAAFGSDADTSPVELASLGEHLHHCRGSRVKLFTLRCVAESMNGFFGSRFVTTLVMATVVIGICAAVL